MKLPIEFRPSRHVGLACEFIAIIFRALEGVLGHSRDREFQGVGFQHGPHFKNFSDLWFGNACYHRATVALEFHKAFCFQALQSFADRDFADAKSFAMSS